MKKKIAVLVCIVLFVVAGFATAFTLIRKKQKEEQDAKSQVVFSTSFFGKVNQWNRTLGTVSRNIPTETGSEGLNSRYPTYGTSLSGITDEEKDNIIRESSLILTSNTTYDSMDAAGNLFLNGEPTGKKLYKHVSGVGMYYGDVSDTEQAVIEQITISSKEVRNFVTGLYAPAGEIVKIEISETDLATIGGELLVYVGQVSHRNNVNNIWKERNDFSRMPTIANKFSVKTTTAYVGNPLGGPIYIYPMSFGNTFTVKISGAVKYFHYVHGQTTSEDIKEMKNYSAPYYDYEIWDMGVRFSGPASYGNFDYDNLVKVGNLWERIIRTSRQVPCSANVTIGVGYVFDCFVAAGEACAFQGGHSWINAPCYWLSGALNYKSMVENGFWGQIHEYNHLYQSYGMESSKTNEVTNNATSLLSYVLYTKISEKRSLNDSSLGGDWNRYTDPSRSLRETIANAEKGQPQSSLNAYADLIHTFGVDVFTKATRLQNGFGVDNWYEALSKATNYNFTYYFEKLLGQTISDEMKALYDTSDRITFVPVATTFQTGRDFYENGQQVFSRTVKPFIIERGESIEINFNERLILPSDFTFEIKKISSPESGKIERVSENVYKYTPGESDYSSEIKVVIELNSENYQTKDVTLTLNFKQCDKNQVETSIYTFGGSVKYSSVEDAVNANFAGYSDLTKNKSSSTFLNGIKNTQIGVVEGKIYIEKTGTYAFCLRSGRGNNTLYLSVNDPSVRLVLSLNTDHGGFALEGEHVVKVSLIKGDYVYFKEITLSRHYANDAFTELGFANLDDKTPRMVTIPTSVLCTNNMTMPNEEFTSEEKYKRVYTASEVIARSNSSSHKFVWSNMGAWSNSETIDNIFDGNDNTYYHNNRNNFVSAENPFILIADIGSVQRFNHIKIKSRTSGKYNLPSTFVLYGSKDNRNWTTVAEFSDLSLNGNSVSGEFNDAEFEYYKLYVTDTKSASASNKYVTISSIEFSYVFTGIEKSPYELGFYKNENTNFTEKKTISEFGKVIKGNGTIKYDFIGTGIALLVRQDNECRIRVFVDGKMQEIKISKSDDKQIAFVVMGLENKKHSLVIEVLTGEICVDSIIEKTDWLK